MDMSGSKMGEGAEAMPGMQVQQLGLKELSDLAPQIRALRYNALDTGKNRAPILERKGDLKEVKHDFLHSAQHKIAFAALHEGKVVGFLSVDKVPQGKVATIDDLWASVPGRPQRGVVGKLLNAARDYLTDHGYPKLRAAPIHASSDFSVVTANPEIGRFLRISHPEAEDVIDIAIAPEELPTVSDAPSLSPETHTGSSDSEPDTHLEKAM